MGNVHFDIIVQILRLKEQSITKLDKSRNKKTHFPEYIRKIGLFWILKSTRLMAIHQLIH